METVITIEMITDLYLRGKYKNPVILLKRILQHKFLKMRLLFLLWQL